MDADEKERPESDDEEDEEDDEEVDPGSGEIDGEDRPYRTDNGHSEVIEGVVDVDEDEESDADKEETEIARRVNGHNQTNGFRVEPVEGEDEDDDGDDDNDSGEEIDEEDVEDDDVVEVHEIDDSDDEEDAVEYDDDDDDEDDEEDEEDEEVDNDEGDFAQPESTGRLTSTEGEIDGHEQGEDDGDEDDNGETGEEEQGVEVDGEFEEEDGEEEAPRQPWHDLHCRIDGPGAYDVLINFEQRWRKATKWTEFALSFKKVSHWHDDALIKIERILWILSPSLPSSKSGSKDGAQFVSKYGTIIPEDDGRLWVSREDDSETWHVQILRSIESGSVRGFPKTVDVSEAQNLICAKNQVIDKSIQTGYIQAIRSAQHFIYIENQYFIGSSYAWPDYKNAADNLIPMELALKIASKIKANERFAVYIVVPMWSEGDPKSATVQEILFWQTQTMQMMYGIVARELKSMQLSDLHPEDYLNFYCLGKKEAHSEEMSSANATVLHMSPAKSPRQDSFPHSGEMFLLQKLEEVGNSVKRVQALIEELRPQTSEPID